MLKKTAALLFMFLLMFSSTSLAAGFTNTISENKPKRTNQLENVKPTVDKDEKVRVIVEVSDQPTINYATQKGVKFSELKESTKQDLESNAISQQQNVKDQLKSSKVSVKYLNTFTTVVNGFSAEVKYGDISKIEKLKNVKKVSVVHEYERPKDQPEMKYSKELVQAQEAWQDFGYKGEGMVVGIIDTGIDSTHRDMVLTDDSKAKLSKDDVDKLVSDNGLPGKYYTAKVPYGYNYMDNNSEIRDLGAGASMHGMHVSGIVGANGDEDNGGIKGIAPEVQLLALKVFGNDPEMRSTFSDVYIKAIDDAIKLGADVLNMSLGSPSGFVAPDDPDQQAIKRATDNGVIMSISAGNSTFYGAGFYEQYGYPALIYGQNPDYGVVGSPSVANESISVASYENTYMDVDGLDYDIDNGATKGSAAFLSASSAEPKEFVQKTFEILPAGIGDVSDFAGKDFKGKFALVKRGTLDFVTKTKNAQNAGAEGVIIYNNTDGIVNMATDPSITIPQLFMLKNDGDKLRAALDSTKKVTITFNGKKQKMDNPDAGLMSTFSSWGVTPDLDFKPEITAPGGQILSTFNDNQYGLMSGTSMAAPHVSGGSALVLERVNNDFDLKNADRVQLEKNLLMNTAKPIDFDGAPVSPRRQGAGLMQLHAALTTPVIVTNAQNEAKVSLKEIKDNIVSFKLTAKNLTDKEAKYEVKVNAQTDTPLGFGGMTVVSPNNYGALDLGDIATVNDKNTNEITVPANGDVEFTITIDLSSVNDDLMEAFTNGYWLDGFVTLTDPSDINPALVVPYSGFKGEWDKAPIFDAPGWDLDNTFYGMTGVVTSAGDNNYNFLGYDTEGNLDSTNIAFSPNDDGSQDDAVPIVSLLRNAKEVQYIVLNKDHKEIRTLFTEHYDRKDNFDSGNSSEYHLSGNTAWDGKINGETAPEGQYYLELKGVIDYPGAKEQTIELPVKLDVTKPQLEKAEFNKDTQTVTVNAKDEEKGSGLAYWNILIDGQPVSEDGIPTDQTEYTLKKTLTSEQQLQVIAVDYAGNVTTQVLSQAVDKTMPELHLKTPEFLGMINTKDVEFSGYVSDKSEVKSVTVDGQNATITPDPTNAGTYNFTKVLKVNKDGVYDIKVRAVDTSNNVAEISRKFLVDSTAPSLIVNGLKGSVGKDVDSLPVSFDVKDNFDDIHVYVNGNEIFAHDLTTTDKMTAFDQTIDTNLPIKDGNNNFVVKVVDAAGNVTTKEVSVKRVDGNSGGDNGGGGIPVPTPPTNPNSDQGQVVTDDSKGESTLVVDESKIQSSIDSSATKSVTLDLTSLDSNKVNTVNAQLQVTTLQKLVDKQKSLVVKTTSGEVNIPVNVVDQIAKAGNGKATISVNTAKASNVPVSHSSQKVVSDVYNFSITVEKDNKQQAVSTFVKPIKVTLSAKVADKDKLYTAVYYLDEKANKWVYSGGKVVGDTVVFSANHFSKYAVIQYKRTFKDIQKHWAQNEIEVLASRNIINGLTNEKFAPNQNVTRGQFAALLVRALNIPTSEYKGQFKDVDKKNGFALQIEAANKAGIVLGSNGKFNPNKEISRQDLVTMLYRAVQYSHSDVLKNLKLDKKFKDQGQISSYAKNAVAVAAELKIVAGRSDNSFDPKKSTTRAETAVFLKRFLEAAGEM